MTSATQFNRQFGRLGKFIGAAVCAATLAGCATTADQVAAVKPALPKMEDLLSKATEASSTGQKEKAITVWKEAAAAFPTDKTPWANIAQARYEAGQYGEAIVNAQEVLVRDPNDSLANSIIAISGLRLSTRALAELSRQNNLSGSTKSESQELAKLLRKSLGDDVLIPAALPPTQPVPRPPKAGKGGKVKGKADTTSASPFDALK